MEEEEFLAVKAAAELPRVHRSTIYHMAKDGRLRVYSARKRLYFKRRDITVLLSK
jgi:excisionase family DNA binding protein